MTLIDHVFDLESFNRLFAILLCTPLFFLALWLTLKRYRDTLVARDRGSRKSGRGTVGTGGLVCAISGVELCNSRFYAYRSDVVDYLESYICEYNDAQQALILEYMGRHGFTNAEIERIEKAIIKAALK